MQNVNPRKKTLWRKIAIIAALPIITFIWAVGWTLTQIASQEETAETRQLASCTHQDFAVHEQEIVA